MVNFSRIKKKRIGHKGQSLVEVAVFGAFLLLVFGFLLNSGMQYNYQQEVKMEGFRRALQMAAESPISKAAAVQLVKDVHFPDPSDMFALGSRDAVQGAASVFWSNNSTPLDYITNETSTTKRYVFNPNSPLVTGVNRTYTTAALDPQAGDIMVNRDSILNGVNYTYHVASTSQTKIYQAEPGYGDKEIMILMNTSKDCEAQYCEKDILGQVKYDASRGGLQYYPVFNATGDVGSEPSGVIFLNGEAGQINSTLEKQQVVNKTIEKDSALTLDENANTYTSREELNNKETLKHVIIIDNGGGAFDDGPTFVFPDAEPSKTWTTPK